MVKAVSTSLGMMAIEINQPDKKVLELRVKLDQASSEPIGFIQTRTLDFTDDLSKDYDVHRTGIWLQDALGETNAPFFSLAYPANLYTRLETKDEAYPKWRITIKTFLVDLADKTATKPHIRFISGFSWGYEVSPDWQALPLQALDQSDWIDATARLYYECPRFEYVIED